MENKTYIWTSGAFTGSVTFTFNQEGILLQYDITQAQINEEQLKWFTTRLPRTYDELLEVLKKTKDKDGKLQLLPTEIITFDLFWNKYDEKVRSSRKKSRKIWDKLSPNERSKAFLFINTYNRSIAHGIGKKYCETYLNAELWNN
jgi:hypothetical protein